MLAALRTRDQLLHLLKLKQGSPALDLLEEEFCEMDCDRVSFDQFVATLCDVKTPVKEQLAQSKQQPEPEPEPEEVYYHNPQAHPLLRVLFNVWVKRSFNTLSDAELYLMPASDAVEALFDATPSDQRAAMLTLMSAREKAAMFTSMSAAGKAAMLESISADEMASMIAAMQPEQRAMMLSELSAQEVALFLAATAAAERPRMLQSMSDEKRASVLAESFSAMDRDNNGTIDFEEFQQFHEKGAARSPEQRGRSSSSQRDRSHSPPVSTYILHATSPPVSSLLLHHVFLISCHRLQISPQRIAGMAMVVGPDSDETNRAAIKVRK